MVGLDDPWALDASLVGAKAAALAAARRAGFPVLPGAVLTTALDRGDELPRLSAWRQASEGGSRPVVVRSSSTVEDGRQQSMAGLFTSVVDVRTLDRFEEAVDEVLASGNVVPLSGERAPLAVLVQPFLDARVGGVLFGVDPVSGRDDRLVVAAAEGGPVALVQGETDGEQATLTRRGRLVSGSSSLPRRDLRRLARLARKAATRFGGPQDVEWAIDGEGELWLLQSRPVTAVAARATGPALGPGPVAETFPEPLSPLEQDLWVGPLRSAIRSALALVGAAAKRDVRRSPVVTAVGGRVAVDLDLFGASTSTRRGLARLDPRPPTRRLVAAWRVGRLRAALPGLARHMLARADAELTNLRRVEELSGEELLGVLDGVAPRLVALHGHEVLMGWLVAESASTTTAASVALRQLARARSQGLSDEEVLARHPTVLALVPPQIGGPAELPPTDGLPLGGDPEPAGEDDAAVLREALRLRTRWLQELSARAAWELGRRLTVAGVLDAPADVRLLQLDELRAAVGSGAVPADFASRGSTVLTAPLPARFRLTEDGVVVADRPPTNGSESPGRGASGGRGVGPVVHAGTGPPPEGAVLVVRTLEPSLAAWLPRLAGLVSETGSPLSHLAILAREYKVPTAVGVVGAVDSFPPGTAVVVDGFTGEVTVAAEAETHQGAA
jgi:pyruvate,water dikinase